MARDLAAIDRDLDVERAIWIMERRAGADCSEARASKRKLDALLEERSELARSGHLPSSTPAPGAPVSSP